MADKIGLICFRDCNIPYQRPLWHLGAIDVNCYEWIVPCRKDIRAVGYSIRGPDELEIFCELCISLDG
jgi:hypothetical protein